MPEMEYWAPTAPPEAEHRHSEWRQALALAGTLRRLWRATRADFAIPQLDRHLRAFRGFHESPTASEYRMRPWRKVRLNAIGPDDVTGIALWELALMFQIAMENEEPIPEYTRQSGEGFRFLLPNLGRFMGTNVEQARYADEHGLPWCVGPWCAEEHRHSNTLARLIERVMEKPPRRDNPNRPITVTASEADALKHLLSRQTTEWNASSSYLVMAAHSRGELHEMVRNLARDEIKHLAILSAAHCYLFGWHPWLRFTSLVRVGLENYRLQRERRSGGRMLGSNAVTAVEGIAAHLLTEFFIRRWLKTVPLRTLRAVFEAPSAVPALEEVASPAEDAAGAESLRRREEAVRKTLGRWSPKQRMRAERQARLEQQNAERIGPFIGKALRGFLGGEEADSDSAKALRKEILRGPFDAGLKVSLLELLRDYQIRGQSCVI